LVDVNKGGLPAVNKQWLVPRGSAAGEFLNKGGIEEVEKTRIWGITYRVVEID
jgi:hypothetical protein